MHKIRFVTYVLLIFTFTVVSKLIASELKKSGFSISLPDGWIEIPRNVIDAYEKEIARLAPNIQVQHYDYGFQLASSKNWFEYPYILVQVKNTGRIPESQLEKIAEYNIQGGLDKSKKKLGSIMSEIQAGKMIYDKQNKIIWMRIELNVANIKQIAGISGIVPTEKGFIQITGYCLKENYSTYEPIFQSVILSVSPEPGLAYKPKWSDRLPSVVTGIAWRRIVGKAIAGGIIGGIIFLVKVLRRKKRNVEKNNCPTNYFT